MAESPRRAKGGPILCPRCGELTTWENNPWRPFCSERCKLIDLAAWAEEDYSIPGEAAPEAEGGEEEK